MFRAMFAAVWLTLIAVPAAADEAAAQTAYDSYRNSMAAGDLRAAADFARVAHEEAAETWEASSFEMYRYIAALARTQNDLFQHRDALQTVEPVVTQDAVADVAELPRYSFEIFFEAGRAARGLEHHVDAAKYFDMARMIAETNYGLESIRAAYAHMELARSYLDESGTRRGDELRNRLIGSGHPQIAGNANSFARAVELFSGQEGSVIELQVLEAIRAGNLMANGDMDAAGESLEPAVTNLVNLGYMDDYVLGLYVDWIAAHLTIWPTRRMERMLLQAMDYGRLRQEGQFLSLARTLAVRHRRVCVDQVPDGYARLQFSIDERGRVPRTAITDTNLPDWWVEEKRQNMRSWIFIPAQQNGVPTRVDNVRWRSTSSLGSGRSCG